MKKVVLQRAIVIKKTHFVLKFALIHLWYTRLPNVLEILMFAVLLPVQWLQLSFWHLSIGVFLETNKHQNLTCSVYQCQIVIAFTSLDQIQPWT